MGTLLQDYTVAGRLGAFGSDDGGDSFSWPDRRRRSPDARYEGLSELVNLREATGRAPGNAASKLSKFKERNPDFDPSGLNIETFRNPDGSVAWDRLASGSSQALGTQVRLAIEKLRKQNPGGLDNYDSIVNRKKLKGQKEVELASKQGLIDEIDPSLQAAEDKSQELLGRNTIDAADEQSIASRITAQAMTAQSSRMAQIAASLGLGSTTNSPAAAALAQQAAEDTSSSVIAALRDLTLQTKQMNQEGARINADLATRIASQRFAVLNGDSKSIIGMRGDIASMIDSLYARDAAMELQKKQLEASSQESAASRYAPYITALGAVAAPFTGGLSLAGAGAINGASALSAKSATSPVSNQYYPSRALPQAGPSYV